MVDVDVDDEKIEFFLKPLMMSLLSLGQRDFVEKYIDLIGVAREDTFYKDHLFFWSYATEVDVVKFNKCFDHLESLRNSGGQGDYDIEKCEQFYEFRLAGLNAKK